ncbi:phosphatidylserine decarboxylase family protein [Blattabacterium cuenoti]|uniref:phosphatidylserine decarboxylase family protein n=1 Tax=Blattabacterium cuenoti TaxID=1653831 RepID=UPI00163C3E1C|nr:phosphatidylserine decarboxylase family protein [Blattabacterium cuenoti]
MIHKEGYFFLIYTLVFILICIFISLFFFQKKISFIISFFSIMLYCFFLFFFRNPKRTVLKTNNDKEIISPADGKVIIIKKIYENEFLKRNSWCISIFMSPFDVHVNRFPVSGKVIYVKYHPGKYWFAWDHKNSLNNERTTVVVETKTKKKILFRQIAGIIARRIILYSKKNDLAEKGEEFGFIKFGSRIDLYLPLNTTFFVKKGEKVIAGKTVISFIP